MRVCIYCRVCSNNGFADYSSLELQKRKCIDYARRNNHEIVMMQCEYGYSGLNIDRPMINKIKELNSGTIKAILVTGIERIGNNMLEVGKFTDYMLDKGIDILSINEGLLSKEKTTSLYDMVLSVQKTTEKKFADFTK